MTNQNGNYFQLNCIYPCLFKKKKTKRVANNISTHFASNVRNANKKKKSFIIFMV